MACFIYVIFNPTNLELCISNLMFHYLYFLTILLFYLYFLTILLFHLFVVINLFIN